MSVLGVGHQKKNSEQQTGKLYKDQVRARSLFFHTSTKEQKVIIMSARVFANTC